MATANIAAQTAQSNVVSLFPHRVPVAPVAAAAPARLTRDQVHACVKANTKANGFLVDIAAFASIIALTTTIDALADLASDNERAEDLRAMAFRAISTMEAPSYA